MNKTMLWVLLAISAVLFLYPSVTTLLDVLEVIGSFPAVSTAVIETRDRAIMQVLGFISLYIFLGALLFYYDEQSNQQKTEGVQENQPSTNLRHVSRKIEPVWSVPVGALVILAILAYQYFSGSLDATDIIYGYFLPILYSVIAGLIAGLATFFILDNLG